jgi:hypothetical protein
MDPEKKARFDNGEDLNEPPQQVPWLSTVAHAGQVGALTRFAATSLQWLRWRRPYFSLKMMQLMLHATACACTR